MALDSVEFGPWFISQEIVHGIMSPVMRQCGIVPLFFPDELSVKVCVCVLVFRQKLVKHLYLLYFCCLCVLFFSVVCKIEAEETSILKW